MNLPGKHLLFTIGSALLLASCHSADPLDQLDAKCVSPRPEVCTFEYRPVCGLLQNGQWQTQGNACSACANPAVMGYRSGACDDTGIVE